MSKSIIVVDDSQIVLDLSEFVLLSAGYRVYTAAGGMEALEIMATNPVDLAIIDINMPDMDGYTLIRKIREEKGFSETPIIIVTTEAEAKDKKKGYDAGANGYIVKPVKPEVMLGHVRLLIGDA